MNISQSKAILNYLRKGKKITPLEALNRWGCFRLGARVYDLKQDGHDIRSTMIWVGRKRVAQYSLAVK